MKGRVLYLSFEGLLEPLGQSQVLAYIKGLVARGFAHTVLSLERSRDLGDPARTDALRAELQALGVRWRPFPYLQGSAAAVTTNCARLASAAIQEIARGDIRIVHARSFVPASIAWLVSQLTSTPYIFDTRADWIQERILAGQFKNPTSLRLAQNLERRLFRDAAGVVALTSQYAEEINRRFLFNRTTPLLVQATCADYDLFRPGERSTAVFPVAIQARLRDKLVIGFVGSLNRAYCLEESWHLFRLILERRPDAHLLCVSRQAEALATMLRNATVPDTAFTIVTVHHSDMPAVLRWMDWGLLMRRGEPVQVGAMPTKLAEFFASGVCPVQFGCNTEVGNWVRSSGTGISLDAVDPPALEAAAGVIAHAPQPSAEEIEAIRAKTRQHFGLEVGVDRYAKLLHEATRHQPRGSGVFPRLAARLLSRASSAPRYQRRDAA